MYNLNALEIPKRELRTQ